MIIVEVEYVLARKILQLANQIIRNRNEDLKGLGLTAEQADALRFFQGSSNRSAVDLKEHLGISHQATRAIVERMVAKGLLMTKISQTDARYKEVSLTEKGMELFEIMQSNCAHTGNQLLSNIGDRDRERFLFLVTQAIDNLKKANESSRGVANNMKGVGE